MRFGPPPRMTTFFFALESACDSLSVSYVE